MKLKTFFDEEFKLFSIYDCQRSIPSIIDGLKVSQRKCIFGLIKRGENAGEIKIAQASGWISQCLDKDTLMHLADGSSKTISELADMFDNGTKELEIYSYNEETGEVEMDICEDVWETKVVDHIIDIELDDGEIISLTEDHIVYTDNGQKQVKDLLLTDKILDINIGLVDYHHGEPNDTISNKRDYKKGIS